MKRILLACVFAPRLASAAPVPVAGVPLGGAVDTNTVTPPGAASPIPLRNAIGDAVFVDLRGFSPALNGCGSSPTNDAPAWSAMVAQINADWMSLHQIDQAYLPPGCIYLNASVTQFGYQVPVHVVGAGSYLTKVILGPGFTGDLIAVDGNFTPGSIANTLTTLGSLSTYNEGARISGLVIVGNTTAPGSQSGVVFYDQNELAVVRDLEEHFLTGCGLCVGLQKNTNYGVTRESQFEDIRIFNSGGGTLTNSTGVGLTTAPELGVYSSCTGTNCTASSSSPNALVFSHVRLYAYHNHGALFCPMNQNQGIHTIRADDWQVEGEPDLSSTGDGIHIGDPLCTGTAPYDMAWVASSSNVPSPGMAALHVTGPSSYGTASNAPCAIDLIGFQSTVGGSNSNTGLQFDYGRLISANVAHCNDTTCLSVGAGVSGSIVVDPGPESQSWNIANSAGASLTLRGGVSYAFTPTAAFSGGGGSLAVSGSGIYRTMGGEQALTESFSLTVSTLGTGTLILGGIPKATTNSGTVSCASSGVSITGSATTLPGGGTALSGFIAPAATSLTLQVQKSAGTVNVTGSNLTAGETLTANVSCVAL